jgi:IclR family mhp operon transcriptional activator
MAVTARSSGPAKSDSIRAVERAIDLLQALNRRPLSTLHDLHCDTGLPKPSIVRLLRTFEAKGLAAPSASYGAYQLLGHVRSLSNGFHHEPPIVALAESVMTEFTRREGWPLALGLFDMDAVVVRASSLPSASPSKWHFPPNMRLSLVGRALGRAYLAYCAPAEQKLLLEMLKHSSDPEDAAAKDDAEMARMIAAVHARGYAMHDPLIEPRASTLAVPMRENGRVIACLGLTWITKAMPTAQAIEHYLPRVLAAAEAIENGLAGGGTEAGLPAFG